MSPATILVFPYARCLGRIRHTARVMDAAGPVSKRSEAHLRTQLERMAERLRAFDLPHNVIARQCIAYEFAVRLELRDLESARDQGGLPF